MLLKSQNRAKVTPKQQQHFIEESRRKMMVASTRSGSGDGATSENIQGGGYVKKKTPRTASEDALMVDYVRSHGTGNWSTLQKTTGLQRCGKSCRLRWVNHLRPNLKKCLFSPEEVRFIIKLHSEMGNKWARMVTHLPGRTDNQIKNFWNTRSKRLQRAGLLMYPSDIHQQTLLLPPKPPHPSLPPFLLPV